MQPSWEAAIKQKSGGRLNGRPRATSSIRETFSKKWSSVGAIPTAPAQFIRESQEFFADLRTRIEKENDERYPLVDSLHEHDRVSSSARR